jgi:hypothetical protein
MRETFVTIMLALLMAGCASRPQTYMRYVGSTGASQDQFMKDRYTCYQETRARMSGAYANQYGAAAGSQVVPPCSAFNACLAARGYYRADTTNLDDFKVPGNYFVPASAMIQCGPG